MKLSVWRLRAAKRDHTTELNHASYNADLPDSTEWTEGVGVSGSDLPNFIDLPHINAGGEWRRGALMVRKVKNAPHPYQACRGTGQLAKEKSVAKGNGGQLTLCTLCVLLELEWQVCALPLNFHDLVLMLAFGTANEETITAG
jgi:hypothetical protein